VQQLSAAQAAEVVGAPQPVNELERLVAVAAVMRGWLERLAPGGTGDPTLALQPGLGPLVEAAAAPDLRIDTMPVDSLTTGGDERYEVREPELVDYVARVMPGLRLGGSARRPRVEILNGTGALGVAQAVADAVVPAGGRVTLTENVPGFGLDATQVVYYEDEWRTAAERLVAAMGCGSLRRAGKDIGIADVTILVGSDCPQYGSPEVGR
jgi:hypothetical protein